MLLFELIEILSVEPTGAVVEISTAMSRFSALKCITVYDNGENVRVDAENVSKPKGISPKSRILLSLASSYNQTDVI